MNFLEELHIITSYTGLFHTLTAILALIFGTIVLLNPKGTQRHKRMGYAYAVCMLALNLSAFGIYNFGGFSPFHGFAIISLGTLLAGLIPAMRRKRKNWFTLHFYFMNWSVVGLYCAFWAELGVRFFDMRYFWWVVVLATVATSGIGAYVIQRKAREVL